MGNDYYFDALLPEVVRYAKLKDMDSLNINEFGAAIFSVWYTQNPQDLPNRASVCNFIEPGDCDDPVFQNNMVEHGFVGDLHLGEDEPDLYKKGANPGVYFTAHTHPNEPLEASPDDILIYSRLRRIMFNKKRTETFGRLLVNFLIDGYACRNAEESDDKVVFVP